MVSRTWKSRINLLTLSTIFQQGGLIILWVV